MSYTPSQIILERYARVLVRFALGGGRGIKQGDVVWITLPEAASAMRIPLRKEIVAAGGHALISYMPNHESRYHFSRDFYEHASKTQLEYFPKKFYRGLVDEIDHQLSILADADPQHLKGIDPEKIIATNKSMKPFMEWRDAKERKGNFSWTLGLFGTPAMAAEAGLSERAYWNQIIKACFLDERDPIKKWKTVHKDMTSIQRKLNKLAIERVHVEGLDVDLWITLGADRVWKTGSGANIPSFEHFTSPDWRGTEGWINFNQPLYRYGNLIENIRLEFKKGKVVKATASKNQKVLREMIKVKNADKLGEFSLTDKRFSRITKFMAHTLYDENMGGPHGNTHVALGKAYTDCYRGDQNRLTPAGWRKRGFNDSAVHTDIISTTKRTVTAYLPGGKEKIIYQNGSFTL